MASGRFDGGHRIDPELVDHVERLPPLDLSADNLEALRARTNAVAEAQHERWDEVETEDRRIDVGPDSSAPIRIYRRSEVAVGDSPNDGPEPAVLEIHGGGFVMGSLAMMDNWCQAVASMAQCTVVSVDYSLAPEHRFPVALNECYAVLGWMAEHHVELGIDPGRVALCGQSAGAALAAGVALAARDRGGPAILHQMLEVPQLDDRLHTRSARQNAEVPGWTTENARDSWAHYLGARLDDDGELPRGTSGEEDPPLHYAAPGRAQRLAGLPSAYISTMQHDPLRDEGINYARRLLHAGVPVELHSYAGTVHGAARVPSSEVAKRIALESITVLRRVLHHSAPAGTHSEAR